ncbi:unnamed protein product, partial [marine sediment metagenome]
IVTVIYLITLASIGIKMGLTYFKSKIVIIHVIEAIGTNPYIHKKYISIGGTTSKKTKLKKYTVGADQGNAVPKTDTPA